MASTVPLPVKRASLHTLGCRLNQSETFLLRDRLQAAGYVVVPFGEDADLGIINTCTVTAQADAKCRQSIRQFIRKNPGAFTAVVGCYSQMGYKEVAAIEGVDLIIGNQDKHNVIDYIGDGQKNEQPVIVRDRIDKTDFTMTFVGDRPFAKRANLKIQDGCDFMCSFCIIPFARGRARSRDFDDLMAEARNLVVRGVRELVLTGVNVGTYDNRDLTVLDVVDALDRLPGLDRIRISSIEPTTIPAELFERMRSADHALLPFLHIPLQSGAPEILKSMRRKYTITEFTDFIDAAYAQVPDLYIGTDVLVGYPGEGEAEFQATCDVILNHPIAFAHVFTYSEREGTLAAKRKDHVPMAERHRRSAHLRRLSSTKRYDYFSRYLGQEKVVLFEDPREQTSPGLTDNFIRVVVQPEEPRRLTNRLGLVRLERVSADFVEGSLVRMVS